MFGKSNQPTAGSKADQQKADRVKAAGKQLDRAFYGSDTEWSKAAAEYNAAKQS